MHILVHLCCAPDAIYFLKRLKEDYPSAKISAFFYDPNIHPYEEYQLRLIESKRVCQDLGIDFIEGEYNLEGWLFSVKGLESEPERGRRCHVCFDFRLERSAGLAREINATHMTTTLLMSPKKDMKVLTEIGNKVCSYYQVEFMSVDYRKHGGIQEMNKLSRSYQLYHQDYCGCVYALFQQKKENSLWDLVAYKGRRPGSKEEKYFIKQLRTYAEWMGMRCNEWEFRFLNWRPLIGKLEVDKKVIPSYVLAYSQSIKGTVRTEVQEEIGDTLYYEKQGLKILLVEKLRDVPLSKPRYESSPTFIVPTGYRELLTKRKVTATLKTEVFHDTSYILLIGSVNAKKLICLPADTTQCASGVDMNQLTEFLNANRESVMKEELSILLAGAESLGRLGSSYFIERTNRDPDIYLDYRYPVL